EVQDVVSELAERCCRRRAREAGADDDDGVLALVGRVDQLHFELVPVPLLANRPAGNLRVELHSCTCPLWCTYAQTAITMNAPATSTASTLLARSTRGVHRACVRPSDCTALEVPCQRCEPTTSIET